MHLCVVHNVWRERIFGNPVFRIYECVRTSKTDQQTELTSATLEPGKRVQLELLVYVMPLWQGPKNEILDRHLPFSLIPATAQVSPHIWEGVPLGLWWQTFSAKFVVEG